MPRVPWRPVFLGAAACALLNVAWLAGGNAEWIRESWREPVKWASLLLAALGIMTLSARLARSGLGGKTTIIASAAASGLGALFAILISAVWVPGQFFHDGLRPAQLAAILVVTTAIGGLVGGAVSLIVRGMATTGPR